MKSFLLGFLVMLALHVSAQTVRIMPLGNSITHGDEIHYSYRFALWQKLRDAGVSFDFVGSMNTNFGGNPLFPDPAFDRDHEGHRGWRADQLLSSLPMWLQMYTPDIVLVHAGTNDMFMGNAVAGTVTELKSIIDVLRNDNPEVTILLAKIIGTTAPENARIVELNSHIDGIAAEKNTDQSRVIVVDQFTGFNPATDAYDGKHPNSAGEEIMAQKWFDALMAILDVQAPTVPQSLAARNITSSGFTLTWQASTDNMDGISYEVYYNGVSIGRTTNSSFEVENLSSSTGHEMTVVAVDAAGNSSAKSTALNITANRLPSDEGFAIYPNPARVTDIHLEIFSEMETAIEIKFIGSRKMHERHFFYQLSAGHNVIAIPTHEFINDIYLVIITHDERRIVRRVLIDKG